MHPIPVIPAGHRANFQTILKAADQNALALMMLYDKEEGHFRPVICMMGYDGEDYFPTPIAILIEDDPYARFEDPTQEFPDADTILEKQ